VNSADWRATQVPSTNLHATARGVARLYTALAAGGAVDGITVIGPDLLAEATSPQSEGWCPVLEREATFGLGFQPTRPDRSFGRIPAASATSGPGALWGSRIRRRRRVRLCHERGQAALAESAKPRAHRRSVRLPLARAHLRHPQLSGVLVKGRQLARARKRSRQARPIRVIRPCSTRPGRTERADRMTS
jgi:hypothetical protein